MTEWGHGLQGRRIYFYLRLLWVENRCRLSADERQQLV